MYSIVKDDEDYSVNYESLTNLKSELVSQYLDIIFLDTIIRNPDRHTKNYGVLTDEKSGRIISMAPNYDNNLSLIAKGYPKYRYRENDFLVKLFIKFLKDMNVAYLPPLITEEILNQVIDDTLSIFNHKVDRNAIVDMCIRPYKEIAVYCGIRKL